MSSEATVEIEFDRILATTSDKDGHALAYMIDFGFAAKWIPASQSKVDERNGIVEMPEWLAIDKELV